MLTTKLLVASVSSSGERGNGAAPEPFLLGPSTYHLGAGGRDPKFIAKMDAFAGPAVSATGRFIAFSSTASNLVASDTNSSEDVFVHDLETRTTSRISVSSSGAEANSWNRAPSISADGRLVAFVSKASNLAPNDTNGHPDVFLHDRASGQTVIVSIDKDGGLDGYSGGPSLSPDGTHVAFVSDAPRLLSPDVSCTGSQPCPNVFIKALGGTSLVAAPAHGSAWGSFAPRLSAGGKTLAFVSSYRLTSLDTDRGPDVYVYEPESGIVEVMPQPLEMPPSYPYPSKALGAWAPTISADGRVVAFTSDEILVPTDLEPFCDLLGHSCPQVFVYDRTTDTLTTASATAPGISFMLWCPEGQLSADGRHVAFWCGWPATADDPDSGPDVSIRTVMMDRGLPPL